VPRPTLFLTVGLPCTGKTTVARRIETERGALRLTKDEGEIDGSEPVGDPPAGFATWDAWRAHRWPPSVS
jgi:predicted kinase